MATTTRPTLVLAGAALAIAAALALTWAGDDEPGVTPPPTATATTPTPGPDAPPPAVDVDAPAPPPTSEPPIDRVEVDVEDGAPETLEDDATESDDDEADDRARLRGRAMLLDRTPASGARIQLGDQSALADGAGNFALTCDRDAPAQLVATTPGWQPAVVHAAIVSRHLAEGTELLVVLPGPSLEIHGVLVDANGNALENWKVELRDGEPMDDGAFPPLSAEDRAAGAKGTPPGRWSRGTQENPNLQRTKPDGSFRIKGLRDGRSYRLRAWNDQTLVDVTSEPVPAGTIGYTFRVPALETRPRVDGIVTDRAGNPLADVRVRLTMIEHRNGGSTSYQTGQTMRTESDGRFVFTDVPRLDLLLRFDGGGAKSLYEPFPAGAAGTGLVIRLATSCSFRVTHASGRVDELAVLDADGERLRIREQLGPGRTRSSSTIAIGRGTSNVLRVLDTATWVVLLRDGQETGRLPLRLVSNRVVDVPID